MIDFFKRFGEEGVLHGMFCFLCWCLLGTIAFGLVFGFIIDTLARAGWLS